LLNIVASSNLRSTHKYAIFKVLISNQLRFFSLKNDSFRLFILRRFSTAAKRNYTRKPFSCQRERPLFFKKGLFSLLQNSLCIAFEAILSFWLFGSKPKTYSIDRAQHH